MTSSPPKYVKSFDPGIAEFAKTRPWFSANNTVEHNTDAAAQDPEFVMMLMRQWGLAPNSFVYEGDDLRRLYSIRVDDTAIQGYRPTVVVIADHQARECLFWVTPRERGMH